MTAGSAPLVLRDLGLRDYQETYLAMQKFTANREAHTADEIWNLQHRPVYTQGRAGKDMHLLNAGDIPVVRIDRGGQITYHGPGQLTQYLLLDIGRLGMGVRQLVSLIEEAVIAVLADWSIPARAWADAPGVYVEGAKIAALGLRVSRGRTYHGLAFNVAMDMAPWAGINPCGLGVPVTQLCDWVKPCPDVALVAARLGGEFAQRLGYNAGPVQFSLPNHTIQAHS